MAATLFSTEAATGEGVGTSLSPWGAGNQGAWELGWKKLPNYFHEALTATWLCGDIRVIFQFESEGRKRTNVQVKRQPGRKNILWLMGGGQSFCSTRTFN